MPDEPRPAEHESREAPEDAPAAPENRYRLALQRLLAPRTLVALLIASIVIHAIGVWAFSMRLRHARQQAPTEIALGQYEFVADSTPTDGITRARFNLHISLLSEVDAAARRELAQRRFKVQQGVEELLRQAHGADFEDPTLAELKREIQELINLNLGLRAVSEVIITDFSAQRTGLSELASGDEKQPSERMAGS